MDEGTATETVPDLKDIEVKIGRKTPEGLLRWMREEASSLRGDAKLTAPHGTGKETGKKSLDEKIRKLKTEMACLRSADVKILQQLLAVHEGIEAVKWLLEERSTLTSRCSSLTSSQYSLGEGPDTSWRGSWSSLQDPNDRLDNVSIGSYLDTLADDMDEYCPSSSESVICSTAPLVSEAGTGGRCSTGAGGGMRAAANGNAGGAGSGADAKEGGTGMSSAGTGTGTGMSSAGTGTGTGMSSAGTGTGTGMSSAGTGTAAGLRSSPHESEVPKQDAPVWSRSGDKGKESPVSRDKTQTQSVNANGVVEKQAAQTGSPSRSSLAEKVETGQSPKLKPYKNGKIELDTCKINGKMRLEYDAHWRWVQSQEDVTFL
ncbi:leucine rich adaptor protein 1 [Betta splendens]|uniref:Leucine rich adaptor protein 1 n=1 Tax=Betta splendens TaxID=158456 RepID=A0A6P7M723_BETSP|nr:leucine rich adaptor protein 1 [Betta splendens]